MAGHAEPLRVAAPVSTWGSDAVVALLRSAGIPYVALNPGSSLRGTHDSVVDARDLGGPELILCPHEEHAVAIARGYAKVAGRPMAAAVHTNVGLLHASLAIYNTWCDRVATVVIGGVRDPDTKWIGQRVADPMVELGTALAAAVGAVRAGGSALADVLVDIDPALIAPPVDRSTTRGGSG